MTFKVEDGSAFTDSNSYGAVAAADSYFLDRGIASWGLLTNTVKQNNLIKATDYLDQRNGSRFIGVKATDEQALAWPRNYTGNSDWDWDATEEEGVIPTKLQYACFEYALRANDGPLAPDIDYDDSGVAKTVTKEKVGPIEREFRTVGGNGGVQTLIRPYPGADMYLIGLVVTTARVIR